MSNSPYGDWADSPSQSNQNSGNDWENKPAGGNHDSGGGGNSYGGGNSGNSGGGNSYGNGGKSSGGNYNKGGGNSYGGGKGKSDFVVEDPGRYIPVTVHVAKDMPNDARELLEMMLRALKSCDFTIRVAVNNDALSAVENLNPDKAEYVRPWKKFEVSNETQREKGWYPSMAISKACELIMPKVMADDNKSRSFKILEAAMIMGRGGKQAARLLITYSPDGMTRYRDGGKESGYMQGIVRVAQMYGITVVNVGAPDAREKFGNFISPFDMEKYRE